MSHELQVNKSQGKDKKYENEIGRWGQSVTPFMHKHGLVLDFGMNTLSTWGTLIPTLTEGQEDLVLIKQ
jgi:hypothetical protein